MAFPFIRFLSFAICALKRRNDAKIWVDFMKTNYSLIMRTALSSLFAALQTRPQLFKERIVISYPADIIAIQRTTYFDLHHLSLLTARVKFEPESSSSHEPSSSQDPSFHFSIFFVFLFLMVVIFVYIMTCWSQIKRIISVWFAILQYSS